MAYDQRSDDREHRHGTGGSGGSRTPGKRSLTDGLRAPVQRKTADAQATEDASATPGASNALPPVVLTRMEDAFGADFSSVRVHEDGEAQGLGAQAFARGADLHFAPGHYDPESARGQHLIAHELAHVVQQSEGRVAATEQMKGVAVNADESLEREADDMADRAVRGERVRDAVAVTAGSDAPVQRFVDPAFADGEVTTAVAAIANPLRAFRKFKGGYEADHPVIAAVDAHATLIQDIAQGTAIAASRAGEVRELVKALNAFEQDYRTKSMVERFAGEDIKLGTEFTFVHPTMRGVRVGPRADEAAAPLMDAWTKYVRGRAGKDVALTVETVGGKSALATRFTYTIKDVGTWYWVLDVDDGCLETQTQPSTLPELQSAQIKNIVSDHIFGGAAAAQLTVDTSPSGGGGHISIDAGTTFGGSAELFLETLLELQNGYKDWQEAFQDEDKLNAPWLAELETNRGKDAHAAFNEHVASVLGGVLDGTVHMGGAVAAVKSFNQRLRNPIAEELKASRKSDEKEAGTNVANNPDHYQAVNVEHMGAPGPGARMELRRIAAQTDYKRLLQDIAYIFTLIDAVRTRVAEKRAARAQ